MKINEDKTTYKSPYTVVLLDAMDAFYYADVMSNMEEVAKEESLEKAIATADALFVEKNKGWESLEAMNSLDAGYDVRVYDSNFSCVYAAHTKYIEHWIDQAPSKMTPVASEKTHEGFLERFEAMGDEELVEAFNREVGNPGWTSSRATYIALLHEEFEKRNFDHSVITDSGGLSLNQKVRLADGKLILASEIRRVYTNKIKDAIKFSIKTHETDQKQKRKGKDIPYVTHPLTVGLILARVGASEDVVAAGILHDTIEDSMTGKEVTKEELAQRFGDKVAELVDSVSEKKKDPSSLKVIPWDERKREALEHIKTFSKDSLLVKSADVLSNTTELIEDYREDGEAVFERFNAPKNLLLQHSLQVISVIIEKWSENPLVEDLKFVAAELQLIGKVGGPTKPGMEHCRGDYSEVEEGVWSI